MSKRPADTPFKQQRLPSWQPVLTSLNIIVILVIIGIIFVPVGTHLYNSANNVYEQTIIYDGSNVDSNTDCEISSSDENKSCTVNFLLDEDVTGPVYVYYTLKNYYQNHRRYVKSRSALQLAGSNLAESAVSLDCDPLVKNGSVLLNPCGLIANSFFTDIISYQTPTGGASMDENGISWSTDSERFKQVDGFQSYDVGSATNASYCNVTYGANFQPYDTYCFSYPDDKTVQYLYETYPNQISPIDGVTNEHFIVWMRTAGLPTFRKLYGKINQDFSSGDTLSFQVLANYEVSSYDASKGLVISTLGSLGGKNPFIGVAYIVIGSISLVLAFLFALKYFLDPRRQGNSDHWD